MSAQFSGSDSHLSYRQLDDGAIVAPHKAQRSAANSYHTDTSREPLSPSSPIPSPTSPTSPDPPTPSPSLLSTLLYYLNPHASPHHLDRSYPARRSRLLSVLRASLSEVLATFFLIYLTCAASLVCHFRLVDPGPTVLINAMAAGLTVSFCIYAWFPISGAHMNPYITLSLLATSHISKRRALLYFIAQLLGGQLAMTLLYPIFPVADQSIYSLIALHPTPLLPSLTPPYTPTSYATLLSCFAMEAIGTFILVLTNFKAAVDRMEEAEEEEEVTGDGGGKEVEEEQLEDGQEGGVVRVSNRGRRGLKGGVKAADVVTSRLPVVPISLAIGCTVGVLVLVGQGSSGGVYNPVRYVSAAMWSGEWEGWWCWLGGQLVGMIVACLFHVVLQHLGLRAVFWREKARDRLRRQRRQQQRGTASVDGVEESKTEV